MPKMAYIELIIGTLCVFIWVLRAQKVHQRENEPRREKTNVLVSDLVRHKLGCTATEAG